MRSLELTVDSETARALAVEAELVGFAGIDGYLKWLVEHRFDVEAEDEPGRKLATYVDQMRDIEAEAEVTDTDGPPVDDAADDDRNGVTARIRDDQLTAAADALSSVDGQRLNRLTQQALDQSGGAAEAGGDSGSEYRSKRPLVDDHRPGEDITDLDTLEVPGWDEESITRRQEAVGAALAFLRDEGEATRQDFVDALYEEYPAGYDSPDSWWECITRGLRQVDRVDPARQESRIWRFRTTPGRVTRISF